MEPAALEFLPVACVTVGRDGRVRSANHAALALFELPADDVLGRSRGELLEALSGTPDDAREYVARVRCASGARDVLVESVAGHSDPDDRLFLRDVTLQRQAEAALAGERARLAGVLDSAMDAIISIDACQCVTLFNQAAERMFQWRAEEALGRSISEFIPERFRPEHRAHVENFAYTRVTRRAMGSLRAVSGLRKNGEEFPIEASISQVEVNGLRTFTVILRDITDRVRAERQLQHSLHEKEVLLREIHHRVKNNLQVVSSLLGLESSRLSDPAARALFADSQARVRSMALVHESLYRSADTASVDFGPYVARLAGELLRSYGMERRITFEVLADDVAPALDTAVSCALLVNEAISNALKHGFPGERGGRVRVELVRIAGGRLLLTVADDGVGFAGTPPRTGTLGLDLIRTLAEELDGTLTIDGQAGCTLQLDFPEPPRRETA